MWMLHQSGIIKLTQRLISKNVRYGNGAAHLRDAGHAHLKVELNGELLIHFDTHDSMDIALGELESCDIYLKRSYVSTHVEQLPPAQARKVLPLGLNYRVLPDTIDLLALRRSMLVSGGFKKKMAAVKQAVDIHNIFGFQPRLRYMESTPDFEGPPKVLFLVAAYDPFDDPDRAPDKVEERVELIETRAQCIRLLRKELGNRFLGGFTENQFAQENYPDLVIPRNQTSQENYIHTVKAHPICIASTGLHGSIGWKLAEYVAFSRAIVSERLKYEVPGNFGSGRNYLEFTSPDGCVEAAVQLMRNAYRRNELMSNNAAYYHASLRPDSLMRNALLSALKRKSEAVPAHAPAEHQSEERGWAECARNQTEAN
jgi:hypothetical protein